MFYLEYGELFHSVYSDFLSAQGIIFYVFENNFFCFILPFGGWVGFVVVS